MSVFNRLSLLYRAPLSSFNELQPLTLLARRVPHERLRNLCEAMRLLPSGRPEILNLVIEVLRGRLEYSALVRKLVAESAFLHQGVTFEALHLVGVSLARRDADDHGRRFEVVLRPPRRWQGLVLEAGWTKGPVISPVEWAAMFQLLDHLGATAPGASAELSVPRKRPTEGSVLAVLRADDNFRFLCKAVD